MRQLAHGFCPTRNRERRCRAGYVGDSVSSLEAKACVLELSLVARAGWRAGTAAACPAAFFRRIHVQFHQHRVVGRRRGSREPIVAATGNSTRQAPGPRSERVATRNRSKLQGKVAARRCRRSLSGNPVPGSPNRLLLGPWQTAEQDANDLQHHVETPGCRRTQRRPPDLDRPIQLAVDRIPP